MDGHPLRNRCISGVGRTQQHDLGLLTRSQLRGEGVDHKASETRIKARDCCVSEPASILDGDHPHPGFADHHPVGILRCARNDACRGQTSSAKHQKTGTDANETPQDDGSEPHRVQTTLGGACQEDFRCDRKDRCVFPSRTHQGCRYSPSLGGVWSRPTLHHDHELPRFQ